MKEQVEPTEQVESVSVEAVADCIPLLPQLAKNWRYARTLLNIQAGSDTKCIESAVQTMRSKPLTIVSYEPTPEEAEAVEATVEHLKGRRFCIMVCADVLNTRKDIGDMLLTMAGIDFDVCVVQIDEGNATSKGRKVKKVYQRNEPVTAYVLPIQQHFHKFDITLHRDKKCITIAKGRKFYELDDTED